MPTKRLPPSASLDHLKHQAKDLLADLRVPRLSAYQRLREFHPKCAGLRDADIAMRLVTLSDAQLCIAREYGYQSWPRLKAVVVENTGTHEHPTHNERITDALFRQAVELLDEGNATLLRAHLAAHPDLVRQQVTFEGDNYFTQPRLIEFVAENPIRQGRLPDNIVEIARLILEAGASDFPQSVNQALGLTASGRVARECGVQIPLMDLFCSFGADPATALQAALGQGEFAAAHHLISLGAPLDLVAAAALGLPDEAASRIPDATSEARQLALALAASHGRAEIAEMLLRAGVDPNRYNPEGGHSHCTPLHSAAIAGHLDTVMALLGAGARLDLWYIHHDATPLDWAAHGGHAEVCAALRAHTP